MGMFDFLDVCSFLRHEMFTFVRSEFVRRPHPLLAQSANHLGMDEHNHSRHDELKCIDIEVRVSRNIGDVEALIRNAYTAIPSSISGVRRSSSGRVEIYPPHRSGTCLRRHR